MSNSVWNMLRNQIVDNRYHLIKLLGSGGFGAVFLTSEVVDDRELRKVALKLIPPHDSIEKEKQFQELEQGMRLNHPNIVTCHSVGKTIIDEYDYLYMVMELADCSLEDYLTDTKKLSEDETLKIALDVALGLLFLHDDKHKLVHRDIKPANIFKVNGSWKIGDFGIARQLGTNTMTQSQAFGSAYYAPPESYDGEISLAWDIWSLGVMICKCCGGDLPYTAFNNAELMKKVVEQPPIIPNCVSKRVRDIIEGCLIKDRRQRWSAKIVLNALDGKENKSVLTPPVTLPPQIPEQHPVTISEPKTIQTDSRTGIEFIRIPAGNFLYGDEKERKHLPEYEIAKYPITVAQYRVYCQTTNKKMPEHPKWGWNNYHPIVNVSWIEAKAYCEFYGYRLPTEEEWEKAARGNDGREFPWGNDWDKNKCVNYDNSKSTQPVGEYLNGASPYGCMDMAGNVWEWTDSRYNIDQKFRVLRGGSWYGSSSNSNYLRCAYGIVNDPYYQNYYYGFRVAR